MKKITLLTALTLSLNVAEAQWTQAGGLTGTTANAICSKGSDIWAATDYGPYKSTDGGASFVLSHTGMSSSAIVFALLAGSNNNLYAGTSLGMYRSTNNGANWSSITTGFTLPSGVISLMETGGKLYAGDAYTGVYVSSDGGDNWTLISTGLTDVYIRSMAAMGSTLYAGTSHGVFKSTNNGSSWTITGMAGNAEVNALAVNGSTIYAGFNNNPKIATSTDGGATWAEGTNSLSCNSISQMVMSGNVILASADQGFLISTDGGGNCSYNNAGISLPSLKSVAIAGNYVYAGVVNHGLYRRPLSEFGLTTPTAIKENNADAEVNVYPNPSQGKIQISLSTYDENTQVAVYTMTGSELLSQSLTKERSTIDLGADVPKGIYFIKIIQGSACITKKLAIE